MADAHSTRLRLRLLEVGANDATWGTEINDNVIKMIEDAIAGQNSISVTAGNVTLSTNSGLEDEHRQALIIITGTPGTSRTVTFPDVEKLTWVYNNSDSTVTLTAGAGTTVALDNGVKALVYSDGATNMAILSPKYKTGTFTPTLRFGGASVGMTYAHQVGRYEVSDRNVKFRISILLTAKGSSVGTADIAGLPFTSANNTGGAAAVAAWGNALSSISGHLQGYVSINGTTINLSYLGTGTATDLTDTNFGNTSQLVIAGHYEF